MIKIWRGVVILHFISDDRQNELIPPVLTAWKSETDKQKKRTLHNHLEIKLNLFCEQDFHILHSWKNILLKFCHILSPATTAHVGVAVK